VANAVDVPIVEGDQEGVLVREVLVERADGNTGPLGYVVGGPGVTLLAEDMSSRVEDALDGAHRSSLDGLSAGRRTHG
jgi:hypothetical protein